jgi:hypothetical protein
MWVERADPSAFLSWRACVQGWQLTLIFTGNSRTSLPLHVHDTDTKNDKIAHFYTTGWSIWIEFLPTNRSLASKYRWCKKRQIRRKQQCQSWPTTQHITFPVPTAIKSQLLMPTSPLYKGTYPAFFVERWRLINWRCFRLCFRDSAISRNTRLSGGESCGRSIDRVLGTVSRE